MTDTTPRPACGELHKDEDTCAREEEGLRVGTEKPVERGKEKPTEPKETPAVVAGETPVQQSHDAAAARTAIGEEAARAGERASADASAKADEKTQEEEEAVKGQAKTQGQHKGVSMNLPRAHGTSPRSPRDPNA